LYVRYSLPKLTIFYSVEIFGTGYPPLTRFLETIGKIPQYHYENISEVIHILFHMTQLVSRNNAKAIILKSSHLSVETRINENTTANELINVNKDCRYVTEDW